MNKSTDYHDYVFRDGKLVGEFEDMYRNSAATPWHQDEQANWMDVRLTGEMLRDLGRFDEIHDLGCGIGHYLDLIVKQCLVSGGKGYGYDISPMACEQAQNQFSHSKFIVLDLTERTANSEQRKTTCETIYDSWNVMVRFPEAGNRHRKHSKSNGR